MAKLYDTGGQFPHPDHMERLAKYEIGRKLFDGKLAEIRERATKIYRYKSEVQYEQISMLYIAANLADILVTKPADMLVGEPPVFESGTPDSEVQQNAINRIVEENGLVKLIHEAAIGAGYRGDAFFKVRYDYIDDYSETPDGLPPPGAKKEPIIETVNPSFVFPETSDTNSKKFKAINIAYVEWVEEKNEEKPYLNVERHVPGYIMYDRFRLYERGVETVNDVPISVFEIGDRVGPSEEESIEATGWPYMLVFHAPYKSTDIRWQGISGLEKLESLLAAINDRLVQIDWILWKHSDPVMYGPPLDGKREISTGGVYISVGKDETTPGYMDWNSQLDGAFKELDKLIGLVFQISETPQWIFGTIVAQNGSDGGTGTSHTDGSAIKARYMPITTKVKRIRLHFDEAIRDALWTAMGLENIANKGVPGFESYEPVYPAITWKDGLPESLKELAEVMAVRTGGRPTLDVKSAIKRLDDMDDAHAEEIMRLIEEDEKREALIEGPLGDRFIPEVDEEEPAGSDE